MDHGKWTCILKARKGWRKIIIFQDVDLIMKRQESIERQGGKCLQSNQLEDTKNHCMKNKEKIFLKTIWLCINQTLKKKYLWSQAKNFDWKIINGKREELQKDHVLGSNSVEVYLKQKMCRNSPAVQWLEARALPPWAQAQSPIGELRSHTPRSN